MRKVRILVISSASLSKVIEHLFRGRSEFEVVGSVNGLRALRRESERLLGFEDLTLLGSVRNADGGWRVRFRTPDSAVHELDVAESLADEPAYLTCESAEPGRARRHRVSAHRVVSP